VQSGGDHGTGSIIAIDSPSALIRREVEPVVVEVYGEGLQAWLAEEGRTLAARVELAGDTAFCYWAHPQAAQVSWRAPACRAVDERVGRHCLPTPVLFL